SFEGVWSLLLRVGGGPVRTAPEASRVLGLARVAAYRSLGSVGRALSAKSGMDALRAVLSQPMPDGVEEDAWVASAIAVASAAWARAVAGAAPIEPNPHASHAHDYIRMVTGISEPKPEHVRALETYLVTVSDHGMNASTFAARVVASTGSDLVSSIVAAI